mmetsp:Transcript_106852/g.166922  ORF Transcript_106852/g.166922 Transcript_106852/m.166922 type:complete len:245 (+) Transcript_106852:153-887(+)
MPASISSFSCFFASTRRPFSCSDNGPIVCTCSTPLGPNVTFNAKNGNSVSEHITYAHSTLLSPSKPARTAFPNLAPAYAIDRVALPLPALAVTTSVPASCTRLSRAGISEAGMLEAAWSCENNGRIVEPACPPMTGTLMFWIGAPVISWTNLLARTTSNVVTPQIFLGSRPIFLYNSAIAGTTELTGLTIRPRIALGQCFAQASTMSCAMPTFTFNKSLLFMPGFRGTPAGTKTKSQPPRHSPR